MSLMGTAVSGMLGDTSWLTNISQNVANANTTGYKDAETEFATVVDEVGSAASSGGGVTASVAEYVAGLGGRHLDRHRPRRPGRRLFRRLRFERRPLPHPQRLVRPRRRRQSRQFGRLLPDGLQRPGRRGVGHHELARRPGQGRHHHLGRGGDADHRRHPGGQPASTAAVDTGTLPSANTAASTYTEETSLVVYDNLGAAHTLNVYFTNTSKSAGRHPADLHLGGRRLLTPPTPRLGRRLPLWDGGVCASGERDP